MNSETSNRIIVPYIICTIMTILFTILWYIDCITINITVIHEQINLTNINFEHLINISELFKVVNIFSIVSLLSAVLLKKYNQNLFIGISLVCDIISFIILDTIIPLITHPTEAYHDITSSLFNVQGFTVIIILFVMQFMMKFLINLQSMIISFVSVFFSFASMVKSVWKSANQKDKTDEFSPPERLEFE